MKYIMLISELNGECPIMFPDKVEHIEVKRAMEHELPGMKVRSAGFVKIESQKYKVDLKVECFGESKSLNLKSHEDDDKIIEICLGR